MSFTCSILQDEVVTVGNCISVELPASSGSKLVTLQANGVQLDTIPRSNGRTLEVPTGDLTPGPHELHIGELKDQDGQVVSPPTIIPFNIRANLGVVPPGYQVIHSVTVNIVDDIVTRVPRGSLIPDGAKRYEFVKAIQEVSGDPADFTFGPNGEQVDRDQVLKTVDDIKATRYGVLDKPLHEKLLFKEATGLGLDEIIDITIWPRYETNTAAQEKVEVVGEPEESSSLQQAFFKHVRSLKEPIITKVKELGGEVLESGIVIGSLEGSLHASLLPSQIRELAKLSEVGRIFLRQEGSAILNLGRSMELAGSDRVYQSTPYRGQGVNVAVWEAGPNKFDRVPVEGRWSNILPELTTEQELHARIVCGVIKNDGTLGARGHAPQCNLFSANGYSEKALQWAVKDSRCTVVCQSFHLPPAGTEGTLSSGDWTKDWTAKQFPYPLIIQAAGNLNRSFDPEVIQPPTDEFVNHKGYNGLIVGNHDDSGTALADDSVFRNPYSPHGDRELPEISANGTTVSAIGITKSGTSLAAAAVAGAAALVQSAMPDLKAYPESQRAILLASSTTLGRSWWNNVASGINNNGLGAGRLNAYRAVQIAGSRIRQNLAPSPTGWDFRSLSLTDLDGTASRLYTGKYNIRVGQRPGGIPTFPPLPRFYNFKIALAWNADLKLQNDRYESVLTTDLDLVVKDPENGRTIATSSSFDNSYEVAQFNAIAGKTYEVHIRRWSGTGDESVWAGIAWGWNDGWILSPLSPSSSSNNRGVTGLDGRPTEE